MQDIVQPSHMSTFQAQTCTPTCGKVIPPLNYWHSVHFIMNVIVCKHAFISTDDNIYIYISIYIGTGNTMAIHVAHCFLAMTTLIVTVTTFSLLGVTAGS